MRFLVDSQLPVFLVEWIREQGHDADHVRGFALQRSDDNTIWSLALERGAVMLTKDRDFAEWAASRKPAPQILWIRVGNAANTSLTQRLQVVWGQIVADLESGAQVVEVGRE